MIARKHGPPPSPARIAILGPDGHDKTTQANVVLTHERIKQSIGKAIYFVACESVFLAGAFLIDIAKTLGLLDGSIDASWSPIRSALDKEDCIVYFDNFESP